MPGSPHARLVTREAATLATMPLRCPVVTELEAEGIDGEPRAARQPPPDHVRAARRRRRRARRAGWTS